MKSDVSQDLSGIEWITEEDVMSVMTLRKSAYFLEDALIDFSNGNIESLHKLTSSNPKKSFHILASAETVGRYAGVKCWVNSATGGAVAVYLLFDIDKGRLLAVIEAGALGALRTAAIALLAAKAMKPERVSKLAIIGSGRQAYAQLAAAIIAVEPEQVSVWSPTSANRVHFASKATEKFLTPVLPSETVTSAVDGADVIVTMTRAVDPILHLADLADKDIHVNAMGAIFSDRAELSSEMVSRASMVVVDDISRAVVADRELKPWLANPKNIPVTLGQLLKDETRIRPRGLTIFKSWGLGVSDLALAKAVYESTERKKIEVIPYPIPIGPALMSLLEREFNN